MGVKNWKLYHRNAYDLTFIFFILISHLMKFYRSKFCVQGLCQGTGSGGLQGRPLWEGAGLCLRVRNRLLTEAVHPWKCSAWSRGEHPCPLQESEDYTISKTPSSPSLSMVLHCYVWQSQLQPAPRWTYRCPRLSPSAAVVVPLLKHI